MKAVSSKMANIYIANLIKKGWSVTEMCPHIAEKYGVCEKQAYKIINRTIEWICLYDQSDFLEKVRATQIARSEYILQQAIEAKDWKTANNIIETINKTYKLYDNVQRVELTNSTVQFKFDLGKGEDKEVTPDDDDENENV